MHPLVNDISGLSDTELENRINKLFQVLRNTRNPEVVAQVNMVLAQFNEEQQRRYAAFMEKLAEKSGSNKNFINIG